MTLGQIHPRSHGRDGRIAFVEAVVPGCGLLLLAAVLAIGTYARGALSGQPELLTGDAAVGKHCTSTAKAARLACRNAVEDDYWNAIGNCNNLSDPLAQYECLDEAALEREQGRARCGAQYEARLDVCEPVGEARYDAAFEPADIGGIVEPNW